MFIIEARTKMGLDARQMAAIMGVADVSNYRRLEFGRREPTKQHWAQVRALLLLHRHGLIPALLAEKENGHAQD